MCELRYSTFPSLADLEPEPQLPGAVYGKCVLEVRVSS